MRRFALLVLLLALPFSVFAETPGFTTSPDWVSFEQALAAAEESGKKIMVDIYAPWCPWCQRLENEVYASDEVRSYLDEHFVATRINIDEEDETLRYEDETFTAPEMAVFLGAQGVPTIAFLSADGDYLTHLPGFAEKDEFLLVLQFVHSEAFREMTYLEFVEELEREG